MPGVFPTSQGSNSDKTIADTAPGRSRSRHRKIRTAQQYRARTNNSSPVEKPNDGDDTSTGKTSTPLPPEKASMPSTPCSTNPSKGSTPKSNVPPSPCLTPRGSRLHKQQHSLTQLLVPIILLLICSAWTWIMLCPSARQPLIPPRCNGLTSNGQRMGEKGHKLVAGLRLALLGDRPIFPMYFQHDRGGAPWLSAAVEDTLVGCCRGKIVFSTGPLRTVADVRAFIEAPFREKSRECAVYVMRIEDIQGEGDGTQSLKELLENGSLMSDAVLPSGKKALVAIATSGTRADLKELLPHRIVHLLREL
eukprot:gene3886-2757_t